MDQLEIMRRQLEAMKQQLDTQQIINKDLLRKIMRRKASWLNRLVAFEILFLPLGYLMFAGICAFYDISQLYAVSFLIFCGIDVAFDWRLVRIPPAMFGSASIIELKKFILKQKKGRFIQTCIMLPLAIVWLIAFFAAMERSSDMTVSGDITDAAMTGGVFGAAIGAVVGVVVVIIIYRRMSRTNDDLLRDISDLENDSAPSPDQSMK